MFLDILANFFSSCPSLSGKKINTDYLSESLGSVSLISCGDDPIYRLYTDGGALYQTVFTLALRGPFDPSFNFSSFYYSFSEWVNQNNSSSSLPALPDGYFPVSLSVLKSGEIKNSAHSSSEFEILCRFIYSK